MRTQEVPLDRPTSATEFSPGLFALVTRVYDEHRIILCLSLGYIAVGGALLTLAHRPWPIAVWNSTFATVWVIGSVVWLLWQYLQSPKLLRAALSPPRVLGACLLGVLIVPTQITYQALKQSIGSLVGFSADPLLYRTGVLLHGQPAWRWLVPILQHAAAVRLLDLLYLVWFGALFVFCLWASWTRHRAVRQRAVIAFLLMWIVGGTGVAYLVPSAGPVFYGKVASDAKAYDGLVAQLDAVGKQGGELYARANQRMLWQTRQDSHWEPFAGISAMPSLHVGIAVLFALVAWSLSRPLGAILAVYAVAIQIGSVVLAWHYAVDGYAGAAIAVVSWTTAGALARMNGAMTP